MNKQEIKAEFKHLKKELRFEYRKGRAKRRYQHRMRREELRFQKKTAAKQTRRDAKKALRMEKRDYKRESFLQKSIYLEKRSALKKKKRDALGSLVKIVTEHAPESLSGSLTLSYILIFLTFAVLQGAFVIAASYYVIDRRATDSVQTVAGTLEAGGLRAELAEVIAEEYAMNIALYRADGSLIYAYGLNGLEAQLPYNETWEKPFSFRYQTDNMRIFTTRVHAGGEVFSLNLAKSMKTENALLSVVVNLLLLSIAMAVSISYLVGHRMTRKMLRPIGVLGRAMDEMSAASLSERLDTANIRTELVEVVDAYNRMLDKIEDAYLRQKQFVSDASHELRTPLAVISGYSDILSRWGAEDPAVRREAVDAIVTQTENMQILLDRLLYIARSENGKVQADLRATELSSLCKEILQDYRMMHPDRVFRLFGMAEGWCDPNLMRQILVILLDNSVKFTAQNGEITVRLSQPAGRAVLEVADNGIGMSAEVAAHAFERFYKGDSSHNEKGFGLGLSIAKLMVEAQGGTIEVESAPAAGSCFRVLLPEKE
ncbi:MAG: hypothetical protein DBX52_07650 [Clostridiales bacterium]|nr:MAG: hypothetical protein DBX52_07650 [Clostridiales bacterium]